MTTTATPPVSFPSSRRAPAATVALAAMGALAVEVLIGYLLLAGAPNPGMAAVAVLPLAVALGLRTGRRWALIGAALVAVLVVALRTLELSFDLVRPGDVAPFLLSVALLLTAGVGVTAAVAGLLPGRRVREAALLAGGAGLAAAAGAVLVLLSPQGDDTGSLSAVEVAALPTVDMSNYRYAPAQLRVPEGGQVAFRFTNDTDDTHTFSVDDLGLDVQVPSGRTRVMVTDAPAGDYTFYCSVGSHREDGMEGRLVVVDGGSSAAPAAHVHDEHSHG